MAMPQTREDCQQILAVLAERKAFLVDVTSRQYSPENFLKELDSVRSKIAEVTGKMNEIPEQP
jgi:hypothetical protein